MIDAEPGLAPVFSAALPFLTSLGPNDCARVFHGRGGCYPGFEHLNMEVWGPVLALVVHAERPEESQWHQEFYQFAASQGKTPVVQRRYIPGGPWESPTELPNSLWVEEQGLHYEVSFQQQNAGLFLDMAEGRKWLRLQSAGARVLNLFAYTCAFGVCAAAGGASKVINMDMSRGVLNRGRANWAKNAVPGCEQQFFQHDILKSLGKISRLGPFDIVLMDPPVRQTRSFHPVKGYRRMLARLEEWLAPGGWLMVTLNDPQITESDFRQQMAEQLPASMVFQQRLANPKVIEEQHPEKGLKVLLYQRTKAD
mgnify:CR=1 FL=1